MLQVLLRSSALSCQDVYRYLCVCLLVYFDTIGSLQMSYCRALRAAWAGCKSPCLRDKPFYPSLAFWTACWPRLVFWVWGFFFSPLKWRNKICICPPTGQFQTAALEGFSVVELPYLGEKLSMFLVLPSHKRTALSQIESHLSAKTITLWANGLKRTKMDIFLPR